MLIGESLRTTVEEIWAHKLRSLLTLTGVVLGTMAVVTMVSLIEAVKTEVWRGLESLGLEGAMFVSAAAPLTPEDTSRAHMSRGLERRDAAALPEGVELIELAAPVAFSQEVISWGGTQLSVRVQGVTAAYAAVLNRRAEQGRFISDLDALHQQRVVVLGRDLATRLFGSSDPLGEWVSVGHHRFQVVGVEAQIGNGFANDGFARREMEAALIPLTTLQALYTGSRQVPLIVITTSDEDRLSEVESLLRSRLWRRHNRVEDFEIENVAAEILEAKHEVDDLLRGWTVVLFAISGIALVVGGIGIFSVLQISLAERLYEIGLRKGVGAQDRDVFGQILVESVFLSVLGAAIGVAVAAVLCGVLGPNFEAGLPLSGFAILLAVLFAIGIGLAAGVYPSLKAARLTPVEALRG